VHRLDRDTSGIVLLARDAETQAKLSGLFERREVEKIYEAVVAGELKEDQSISLPLRRDLSISLPPTYIVDHEQGRPAETDLQIISIANDGQSRVRLKPRTGRSHQLRVHCQAIGHPIVGDPIYGITPADRLMLHASRLSFSHPATNDMLEIESPVPF